MTNAELWDQYQRYTRDATEFGRKIGFAAAAICWFFRNDAGAFPAPIVWALLWLVGFFVADLLQSLVSAAVYRVWIQRQETKRKAETGTIQGEYRKPRKLDYPAYTFFWIKMLFLFLAYLSIGHELWTRLAASLVTST